MYFMLRFLNKDITKKDCWYKWDLMEMYQISYVDAHKILQEAVDRGVLSPEDYYYRFIVKNLDQQTNPC
ncbi:hypothetical protein NVP1170O_065 [Vibrio phage 1.170.O._10N.261.52.C3]|nr:hypothetical protein NVP1170O_065 [Vibrio phage 1.170.O._10N.261.52.C3]